eukprot:8764151-Prorocentrum_lima.AAC.1
MTSSLVGSEMCIRDSLRAAHLVVNETSLRNATVAGILEAFEVFCHMSEDHAGCARESSRRVFDGGGAQRVRGHC